MIELIGDAKVGFTSGNSELGGADSAFVGLTKPELSLVDGKVVHLIHLRKGHQEPAFGRCTSRPRRDFRGYQIDRDLRRTLKVDKPQQRSGVPIVPAALSPEEWKIRAAANQAKFRSSEYVAGGILPENSDG